MFGDMGERFRGIVQMGNIQRNIWRYVWIEMQEHRTQRLESLVSTQTYRY